jgi:predicted DNA-binding transcriptional regulator AlpA
MSDCAGLPGWPRALREEWAAAYVGMSASLFRTAVASEVSPVRLSKTRVAWLREDLDAWLDRRAGRVAGSTEPENPWHRRA